MSGCYNKLNFEVAKFAAGKDKSHYSMSAVLVKPDRTVATDGTVMVEVTTPNGELSRFPRVPGFTVSERPGMFLLDKSAALKYAKQMPTKESILILNHAVQIETDSEHVGFISTDLEVARPMVVKRVTDIFPNYDRIMESANGEARAVIYLDAHRLAMIAEFLAQVTGDKYHRVKITIPADISTPVKFEANNLCNGQKATALLMRIQVAEEVKTNEDATSVSVPVVASSDSVPGRDEPVGAEIGTPASGS